MKRLLEWIPPGIDPFFARLVMGSLAAHFALAAWLWSVPPPPPESIEEVQEHIGHFFMSPVMPSVKRPPPPEQPKMSSRTTSPGNPTSSKHRDEPHSVKNMGLLHVLTGKGSAGAFQSL